MTTLITAAKETKYSPVVRALALTSGDLSLNFDPGCNWFNFSVALVNSQLVCLRPVGILNSCCCCCSVLLFR